MAISNTLFFPSSLAVPRTLAHPALSPPLPTFASSFVNRAPLTLATKLRVGRPPLPPLGSAPDRYCRICIQPAAADGADTTVDSTSTKSMKVSDDVPMPIVLIDQDSDYDSTVVQLSFGDRLGALLDTINTLKDLGLKVTKGSVTTKGSVKQTKLFITRRDNGRKVEDPELLEEIRLSIINNLLQYHPESSELLALGEAFGIKSPKKKVIPTHVQVINDGSRRSLLIIETADRPGLLLEILEIIADINVKVESAEIETEGLVAKDKFHVSYGGAALTRSLSQVLINCLRYYLRRPDTEVDSY